MPNLDGMTREKARAALKAVGLTATFSEQESVAFVTGNGVSRPRGFLSYDTVGNDAWVPGKIGIVGTGEMGIGNTTPSSAIIAAFSGKTVAEVTHRGTGIGDEALINKIRVIEQGLALNTPDPRDPLDVLAKVGGLEIAAIAGLVLGCAANSIPVVIDGFISTAGALIASELHPHVRDYIFAAHESVEIGHRFMLERIGTEPILDLGFRLGEGTGAALAMTLIEAGVKVLKEMATFEQAGVSQG